MTKQALFNLINDLRKKHGDAQLDTNSYIKALSILEAQGYIETQGEQVIVLKVYPEV